MRTEDVLAAADTGVWRWSHGTGLVTLDAIAAELHGLPARPVTLPESQLHARIHPDDYIEMRRVMGLAATEERVAEVRYRVIDPGTSQEEPHGGAERDGEGDGGDRPEGSGDGKGSALPPATIGAEQHQAPEETESVRATAEVVRTLRTRFHARQTPQGIELSGTVMSLVATEPMALREGTTGGWAGHGWERAREAFLLEAGRALSEARTTIEVLQVANSLSLPGFTPVGQKLFGVHGDRLSVLGSYGTDLQSVEDQQRVRRLDGVAIGAEYPAAEAARTGHAVYVSSPEEYATRYPDIWDFVPSSNRKSWAYLPLSLGGGVKGVWVVTFLESLDFTSDERSVLNTVGRMLAEALGRTHVFETERGLTADLQHTMAPAARPEIPGAELVARYIPTGGGLQIGGDWYDIIPLPSGRVALVVGDVKGHDVPAAAVMAQLRIALRAYAAEGHSPEAVLARASRFLSGIAEQDEERFATCLYLEVDPRTGALEAARAGHPDLAIRLPDGTAVLRPTVGGPPLGVVPDWVYPSTRMALQAEETLLLCTDGLLQNGGYDLHSGWRRLRSVLEGREDEDLGALADALIEVVHGSESEDNDGPVTERREDDIVLLLFRLQQPGDDVRRLLYTVPQAEPGRIGDARRQLSELLSDWADPDQVDGAVLMLSEVVTNALKHTDCDARITAEVSGSPGARLLRVEVSDESEVLPHVREPGELASSGRGLLLMSTIADDWGVDPKGEGKSTWFELNEHEPATATSGSGSGAQSS